MIKFLERWFPKTYAEIFRAGVRAEQQASADKINAMEHKLEDDAQKQILAMKKRYYDELDAEKEKIRNIFECERQRCYDAGFEKAKNEILDPRKSFISFDRELVFPLTFRDYSDPQEREEIAGIVKLPSYQQYFKFNMICQCMKLFREAREEKDVTRMGLKNALGNYLLSMVYFYDNAGKQDAETPKDIGNTSFDSLLNND